MTPSVTSTIDPEKILKELSDLWVSLGKHTEDEEFSGVLRACAMTLIVACEESEDASAVGETLARLMPEHPSRAIVIRLHPSPNRILSSRVFSQCWLPFGHRRQICCEQIEITASDSSLADVANALLPLTIGDLPVVLWCRSPRLFRLPAFPHFSELAQKLIVDSAAFPEPRPILSELAASQPVIADLVWTRLTRWRELVSHVFENQECASRLPQVSQVRITFGGEIPPVAAYYLGAWLLNGLSDVGSHAQLDLRSEAQESARDVGRVELLAPDTLLSISTDGQMVDIHVGSLAYRAAFPVATECELMREELSIPGRDPVYERTLPQAARLAAT